MVKLQQYIPFHLAIILVMGIIVANSFLGVNPIYISGVAVLALLLMFVSVKKPQWKMLFQVAVYSFTFFTIWWRVLNLQPDNQKLHMSHFDIGGNSLKTLTIDTQLAPTIYQHRFIAHADFINNQQVTGQVLVYINRDSLPLVFPKIGQRIQTFNTFQAIPRPLNPGSFDYADYMAKKGVFHQVNLNENEYVLAFEQPPLGLKTKIGLWRQNIQEKLLQYNFEKDELGVLNALILGDKRFISGDIRQDYASAGAVHLLAVSGLHVGIIFIILFWLLKPLDHIKHGKVIRGLIIIILLWGFALLTGLSGSVVRAVTMFTFISIGQFIRNRRSPVLHSLVASFVILLVINPNWLYDVGFQLSYAAVLGIVLFQPLFENLLPRISWQFPRKIWQLATVSIAATLGTLPLSLYYFHQFPGLFLLSNVVIVPLMSVVLGLGIVVIVLVQMNFFPEPFIYVLNMLLHWINQFISWIAMQEQFLFRDIPFTLGKVIVSFALILLFYLWMIKKERKYFYPVLIGIMALQLVFIYDKWQVTKDKELIIFHKTAESIIGVKQGKTLILETSIDTSRTSLPKFINDFSVKHSINKLHIQKLDKNYFSYDNQLFMIVDSLAVYEPIDTKPFGVLLTQSPQLHLEKMIKTLHPQLIIADGSNYKSIVSSWEKTCDEQKVDFYYTGEKGAFRYQMK